MALESDLSHRLLNNIQLTLSLFDTFQDKHQDTGIEAPLEDLGERLFNMSIIYEVFLQAEDQNRLSLRDYLESLRQYLQQEREKSIHLEMNNGAQETYFNMDTLFPLAIVLFELFHNSVKFAVTQSKTLKIDIDLKEQQGEGYLLQFRDNGPGFEDPNSIVTDRRLGAYLLKSMSRQLNGNYRVYNDSGAVYEILFTPKK